LTPVLRPTDERQGNANAEDAITYIGERRQPEKDAG
jgi:hypothetical protein